MQACSDLGSAGELTEFVEVIGALPAEETGGEEESPREEDVGQPGERPPAHEQAVGPGRSAAAASPCKRNAFAADWDSYRARESRRGADLEWHGGRWGYRR